jgi:hypothetical protein
MSDNNSVEQLIVEQIRSIVERKTEDILDSIEIADVLDQRIGEIIQSRINGKFSNISSVPELVDTVQQQVKQLFDQGHVPGLDSYVDVVRVTATIDSAVQALVDQLINNLVVDSGWLGKIQNLVDQHMTQRVLQQLSTIDINSVVVSAVKENFDQWKQDLQKIVDSPGIKDSADSLQLSVMDQVVVVENDLIANNLSVEQSAEIKGDLVVNNFVVKGTINTDNTSWDELTDIAAQKTLEKTTAEWNHRLVQQVLTLAKEQGVEFDQVLVNGSPLISGNQLSSTITQTAITRVGVLEDLTVDGQVHFSGDTFNTLRRRVGINTRDPEMALSVWDEDVSLLIGRLSAQHGYIGTARSQSLSIGTNRKSHVEIDAEGLTTVKQLRVGQHRISFGREVPGYSGTRGDIVFNMDPKPNTAFAWQCLGGFKWNPVGQIK